MPNANVDYLTFEEFPHLATYLETSVYVSFLDEEMRINMRNFFIDQVRDHLRSKTDDEEEIQRHCRIADDIYSKKRLAMVAHSDELGVDVRMLAKIASEDAVGTVSAIAQSKLPKNES